MYRYWSIAMSILLAVEGELPGTNDWLQVTCSEAAWAWASTSISLAKVGGNILETVHGTAKLVKKHKIPRISLVEPFFSVAFFERYPKNGPYSLPILRYVNHVTSCYIPMFVGSWSIINTLEEPRFWPWTVLNEMIVPATKAIYYLNYDKLCFFS